MKTKTKIKTSLVLALALCSCARAPSPTIQAASTTASAALIPASTGSISANAPSVVNPTATPGLSVAPVATPVVSVPPPKVALIYNGRGVCTQSCAATASSLAIAAGLTPTTITADVLSGLTSTTAVSNLFQNVAAWIQPGGSASTIINGIPDVLKSALVAFIQSGGGYAGFDAGALISTALIGNTGLAGLGIFPGQITTNTTNATNTNSGNLLGGLLSGGGLLGQLVNDVVGPVISDVIDPILTGFGVLAQPVGVNSNNTVAAAKALFGQGRVFVSTTQPTSGSAQATATDMIKWIANL